MMPPRYTEPGIFVHPKPRLLQPPCTRIVKLMELLHTSINTRTSSDAKVHANQSFWHYSAHLFSEPYTYLGIGAGLSEPPDADLFFRWTRNNPEQLRQTSDRHVTYRRLSQQLPYLFTQTLFNSIL